MEGFFLTARTCRRQLLTWVCFQDTAPLDNINQIGVVRHTLESLAIIGGVDEALGVDVAWLPDPVGLRLDTGCDVGVFAFCKGTEVLKLGLDSVHRQRAGNSNSANLFTNVYRLT